VLLSIVVARHRHGRRHCDQEGHCIASDSAEPMQLKKMIGNSMHLAVVTAVILVCLASIEDDDRCEGDDRPTAT